MILHMFFISHLKGHLSSLNFASSLPSLLGAIYYFIPNYARTYRVLRCWVVSPPTETSRKRMLQETRRRFPAPCRPSVKKKKASTGEQFEWKTPAMQNKVSLYCFFHETVWLPFMNNERGYKKTNKYSKPIIQRNNLNNNGIAVLGMIFFK